MYEQLSIDSHNYKLPIIVSGVLHNDFNNSLFVIYYVSEGDYKNIKIDIDDLWDFVLERNYNIDFSFYIDGEKRNLGYDATNFEEYIRFWNPDLTKILNEFINEYLPNGRNN